MGPADAVILFNEFGLLLDDRLEKLRLVLERKTIINALDQVRLLELGTMPAVKGNISLRSRWFKKQQARLDEINEELKGGKTAFQKLKKKKSHDGFTTFARLKFLNRGADQNGF
jgi:hypothetical protein